MTERASSTQDIELVRLTPDLVTQAFDFDLEHEDGAIITNLNHEELINNIFEEKPSSDKDKDGWLYLLETSYLGYATQEKLLRGKDVTQEEFIKDLENQLAEDDKRWKDTWKKRPIEGQLQRVYARYKDYSDQHKNASKEFEWLKVAGEAIICLARIENPNYQK